MINIMVNCRMVVAPTEQVLPPTKPAKDAGMGHFRLDFPGRKSVHAAEAGPLRPPCRRPSPAVSRASGGGEPAWRTSVRGQNGNDIRTRRPRDPISAEGGWKHHRDVSTRAISKNRNAHGAYRTATPHRMAAAVSKSPSQAESRFACPHHRLSHAGDCLWRPQQSDSAEVHSADQGITKKRQHRF